MILGGSLTDLFTIIVAKSSILFSLVILVGEAKDSSVSLRIEKATPSSSTSTVVNTTTLTT